MSKFRPIHRSVPIEQVIIYHIARELLTDHQIEEKAKIWGATQISKHCDIHNSDDQQSQNKVVWFLLLMAKQTNTGRFALLFNENLDQILDQQQGEALERLMSGGPELFAELYQNKDLTHEERSVIEGHVKREHNAMLNAIESLIAQGLGNGEISIGLGQSIPLRDPCGIIPLPITSCTVEKEQGEALCLRPPIHNRSGEGLVPNKSSSSHHTEEAGLFRKCYRQTCLGDPKSVNDPFLLATGHHLPDVIFMVDHEGLKVESRLNHVYCFDYMDLLQVLCQTGQNGNEKPINPYTGRPFSDIALQQLVIRLRKEIKMYYFYHHHSGRSRQQ